MSTVPGGLEAFFSSLGDLTDLTDGLTIDELALRTGRNRDWVMDKLRLVAAAGHLQVGKKPALDVRSGKLVPTTCYKVTPVSAPPAKPRRA